MRQAKGLNLHDTAFIHNRFTLGRGLEIKNEGDGEFCTAAASLGSVLSVLVPGMNSIC